MKAKQVNQLSHNLFLLAIVNQKTTMPTVVTLLDFFVIIQPSEYELELQPTFILKRVFDRHNLEQFHHVHFCPGRPSL